MDRADAHLTDMASNHHHMARASAKTRSARAAQRAADLAPTITGLRASGATSLRALAAGLNRAGIAAPRAPAWTPMAVKRELARILALP